MRDKGYRVSADYMTVDTEVALERNMLRYLKTGRYVPDEIVSGTHSQISSVFPDAVKNHLFDDLRLWDTNISGQVRLIAEYKNGAFTIHEQGLYRRFLEKSR